MPIYRITGSTRAGTGCERFLEADNFEQALESCAARGLFKLDGHQVKDDQVPTTAQVLSLERGSPDRPAQAKLESELLSSPVWTIAKGVAAGLFLHSLIIFLIWFFLTAVLGIVIL